MQTINKWTLAIVVLCWVAGAKAQRIFASLNCQNFTSASHTEDYIKENKRQYENNIEYMQARLDDYGGTYKAQIGTVLQLSKLMNFKMRDVAKQLEFLGDPSKHCVQKYKKELPMIDSVKPNITNCMTMGKNVFTGIFKEAEKLKVNLNSWYNNVVISLLDDCKNENVNSQLSYSLCAIEMIARADSEFATNMKAFDLLLQNSVYTIEGVVREARDCTYDIVNKTTKKIDEVVGMIENCTQSKESCPTCSEPQKACALEITVPLEPEYYKNETIPNPFRILSAHATCVRVKFD